MAALCIDGHLAMKKTFEVGVLQEILKREEDLEGRLKIYKSGESLLKIFAIFLCLAAPVCVNYLGLSSALIAAFAIPAGIMIGIAIMLGKDVKRIKITASYTSIDTAAVKNRLNQLNNQENA
jgi:hypothetical protein